MQRGCIQLSLGGRWTTLLPNQEPSTSLIELIKEQDPFGDTHHYFPDKEEYIPPNIYLEESADMRDIPDIMDYSLAEPPNHVQSLVGPDILVNLAEQVNPNTKIPPRPSKHDSHHPSSNLDAPSLMQVHDATQSVLRPKPL